MNEFRIKPKKETNRLFIVRMLFCFLLASGSLSVIYMFSSLSGSGIFTTRGYILVLLCAIPSSLFYAYLVDKLGSGLTDRLLGWTSRRTGLNEQLSADLARARFSKGRKQFREALLIVNEILQKHPDFPEARLLKAQIVWEGFDNRELALRNLDKVMKLVKEDAPTYRWALNYYHEIIKSRKPKN